MKKSFLFLFSILCFSCISTQNFNKISREILECHFNIEKDCRYSTYYHYLRERTQSIEKIHGNLKHDTIYIMEYHGDWPTKKLYVTIWNCSDTIYIEAEELGKGKLMIDSKYKIFPEYMYYLVSKWDYDALKRQGELYPTNFNVENIFATRIIIHKRKYSIDCMYFREFFKFERDQFLSE